MTDELMTPDGVCAYLKINKDWLYDQVQAGRIRHIRLGRQLRFRRAELDAYLDTHVAGNDLSSRGRGLTESPHDLLGRGRRPRAASMPVAGPWA